MSITIDIIQTAFKFDKVLYSQHAKFEMEHEKYGKIYDTDVESAIFSGEIIKAYPDDKPYPSALILGTTKEDRPLHIVCAYNFEEGMAVLITAYQPDPDMWENNKGEKKHELPYLPWGKD